MNAPVATVHFHPRSASRASSTLEQRLRQEVDGEVLFDAFSRGRYSTDASIYQIEPVGVVLPRTEDAARAALEIAAEERVAILPRGAGTSQCGQTVGAALVIDNSKYLNRLLDLDATDGEAVVQPGLVLDRLNAELKPHGWWFPVDVSTSAQATLGGMAGNNSCGSRSIRYGNMVHNVLAIEAWLSTGELMSFGPSDVMDASATATAEVVAKIHEIARREAAEIAARWPTVLRRVQGYNLDMVQPDRPHNLAHLLVGSEGTLGYFRRLRLKLSRIPKHKVLGICHFPSFYRAMDVTRHIVALNPDAVELVDSTMIGLARDNAAFRPIVERFLRGQPEAILLVEFAGDELAPLEQKLQELAGLIGDLGLPESVVQITDARLQRDVWEVRKAGLNIMMSMKGDGKPVSFIEDCAVPLEHLAEYTDKLTRVFEKHGTRGTWYAHASVGTLHVRPVLNMKTDGAKKMRAIAEEACALVRQYKGSAFSGEHGDGLVRSEWIEPILGERLTRAIAEIKDLLDPKGLMNPGKIVRPTRMDDPSLFRYQPGYHTLPVDTALDWSEWGGFPQAVEMCNNNGHCRKFDAGTMCPSFRVTGDEQHLTRGRANTLRLALSGQLGTEALTSDAMLDALDLCVSCKGCRRECPTGVDMARMKIEVLHQINRHRRPSLRQKAIAYLPRYAPVAARMPGLMNLRDRSRILAGLTEKLIGLSARRTLPKWRRDTFLTTAKVPATLTHTGEVVLFADTFNNYFESANLHAASDVLRAAGYDVHLAQPLDGRRPLCCGRTFLAAGMVGQARAEQRRLLEALAPYLTRDLVVLGLEPSCLLTMRDEMQVLWPAATLGDLPRRAMMFEEFIAREREAGRWKLDLAALSDTRVLLHGHCHQKAFGVMPAVEKVLRLVPGLEVETIASSCCGMAGAFGYESEHYDLSLKMGEAGLLPAVRDASGNTLIVADGVSCRHQILDGAGREALHVARVLQAALAGSVTASP
ncbi:MAG: FAD-binding oxidoreductase [Proteobacteria bacterium]|nr:MAG: FAD-binding oxidoreductase [Pseudomonadota bacterium]